METRDDRLWSYVAVIDVSSMPHHDGVSNVTSELSACVDRLDPRELGAGRSYLIKTGFSEHQRQTFCLTIFF